MGEGQDQREARVDARLGKLAVQKGRITPEQLQQALEEQRLGVQRGRKKPRRLGVILASRHLLTDDQVLELLEEQEAHVAAQEQRRREDRLLGQILIDGGFAESDKVEACLRIQEESILYGAEEIPLLGELLLEKGFATAEGIEEALDLQRGVPLVCRRCGEELRVGGIGMPMPETCPQCGEALEPVNAEPAPPPPPPAPEPAPPAAPELQRLGR